MKYKVTVQAIIEDHDYNDSGEQLEKSHPKLENVLTKENLSLNDVSKAVVAEKLIWGGIQRINKHLNYNQ